MQCQKVTAGTNRLAMNIRRIQCKSYKSHKSSNSVVAFYVQIQMSLLQFSKVIGKSVEPFLVLITHTISTVENLKQDWKTFVVRAMNSKIDNVLPFFYCDEATMANAGLLTTIYVAKVLY
jgi:hypothetical protein